MPQPQPWVQLVTSPAAVADGTALASSAAIGVISPNATTNPPFTIPANTLFPGALLRVRAWGKVSNTGTPTLTIALLYGGSAGVTLATTGAVTTVTGLSNNVWRAEFDVIVRTIGSSGTAIAFGSVNGISGTSGVSENLASAGGLTSPAVATIDTTAAKTLDLCATWSASSASNTITCQAFSVESLNALAV